MNEFDNTKVYLKSNSKISIAMQIDVKDINESNNNNDNTNNKNKLNSLIKLQKKKKDKNKKQNKNINNNKIEQYTIIFDIPIKLQQEKENKDIKNV